MTGLPGTSPAPGLRDRGAPTRVRLSSEALAAVSGATLVDAIVMASAAGRGDVVYTSDFADLDRLSTCFPSVRVLGV